MEIVNFTHAPLYFNVNFVNILVFTVHVFVSILSGSSGKLSKQASNDIASKERRDEIIPADTSHSSLQLRRIHKDKLKHRQGEDLQGQELQDTSNPVGRQHSSPLYDKIWNQSSPHPIESLSINESVFSIEEIGAEKRPNPSISSGGKTNLFGKHGVSSEANFNPNLKKTASDRNAYVVDQEIDIPSTSSKDLK